MTIGGIQAFVGYVTFMMWPIQDLARVYAEMQHAIASAERIFSLVDAVPDVADRTGAFDPGTIRGDIEFDHVDFYYEDDKPVLTDFSLKVKRGETIALVGPTGGGKSTIVNLVCRFYEPKEGVDPHRRARLHATSRCTPSSRASAWCCRRRTCSPARSARTSATAGWTRPTRRSRKRRSWPARTTSSPTLDKGYDAEVGEGGNRLSVGQKQLISLARAVLAQPEIFVMDEATSSVDTLTEALIQQGMERLMDGRTSFVIAHRLSPSSAPTASW